MAKFPKPFFRTSRKCWFVQIGKQQVKLRPDEVEARKLYHELMAEQAKRPKPVVNDEFSVAEVFDKFLDWCKVHRAATTFEGHFRHIKLFCAELPETETMPASDLRPYHIIEFADRHSTWGVAARRRAIQELQRPFSWAERLGYIDKSPVRHIEKPRAKRREQSVSIKEWGRIRDHYREGDPFRDILEFLWETGCRPQEAKALEARHIDLKNHRAVFPKEEAKGKRRARVIVFTPRAKAIVARRLKVFPRGVVFKNADGKPWTAFAMNCRFQRLKTTIGVKFAAYSLRHGFADRMLMNGTDCMTVAALMGHVNTEMLSQHYAALDRQTDYLRQQLTKTVNA